MNFSFASCRFCETNIHKRKPIRNFWAFKAIEQTSFHALVLAFAMEYRNGKRQIKLKIALN